MVTICRGIDGRFPTSVGDLSATLKQQGYKECEPHECEPTEDCTYGYYEPVYTLDVERDIFVQGWRWKQDDERIRTRIAELQVLLTESDFIYTKRDEYTIVGKDLPHDASYYLAWSNKRDIWRGEIENLRNLLPEDQ